MPPPSLHAAQLLLARGRHDEAAAELRAFLARSPDHHQALVTLGRLLQRLGRGAEAADILGRAARAEAAAFASGAGVEEFLAAAVLGGPPPDKAPAAYIAASFDDFADGFDDHLRDAGYCGPELLLAAVSRVAGGPLEDLDVLDLGCGTGLVGEAFRPLARRLDGVDLSPKMLAKAAAKGVYDRLAVGDLVSYLDGAADRYDLVLSADVFIYIGDLAPSFAAARRVLRPGGRLAFTVEAGDGEEYVLHPNRRYTHPRAYLLRTAAAAGFAVRELSEATKRTEARHPVRSFVGVLAAEGA